MGKTPNIKYETPAPDSPVGESRRGKETPKDPAKAGPTGQGERESKNFPDFFVFKKYCLI